MIDTNTYLEPGTLLTSKNGIHVVQPMWRDLADSAGTYIVTTFYGTDFTCSSDEVVSFSKGRMREHPPFPVSEVEKMLGEGVRVAPMETENVAQLREQMPELMAAVDDLRERRISQLRLYFGG